MNFYESQDYYCIDYGLDEDIQLPIRGRLVLSVNEDVHRQIHWYRKCPSCEQNFYYAKDLKKHIKRKHPFYPYPY